MNFILFEKSFCRSVKFININIGKKQAQKNINELIPKIIMI